VAEWLGRALQKLLQRFESAPNLPATMKYSQWLGIFASCVLVFACFLPWTWHPDLNKEFSGFFSEGNVYGRPGRVFTFFAVVAIVFFLIPKIWAKRWNLLVTGLTTAFAVKSFIMYAGCYRGICPEKRIGLWVMLVAAVVMLVMAILPDVKLKGDEEITNNKLQEPNK
jgi:hypothetical protein